MVSSLTCSSRIGTRRCVSASRRRNSRSRRGDPASALMRPPRHRSWHRRRAGGRPARRETGRAIVWARTTSPLTRSRDARSQSGFRSPPAVAGGCRRWPSRCGVCRSRRGSSPSCMPRPPAPRPRRSTPRRDRPARRPRRELRGRRDFHRVVSRRDGRAVARLEVLAPLRSTSGLPCRTVGGIIAATRRGSRMMCRTERGCAPERGTRG